MVVVPIECLGQVTSEYSKSPHPNFNLSLLLLTYISITNNSFASRLISTATGSSNFLLQVERVVGEWRPRAEPDMQQGLTCDPDGVARRVSGAWSVCLSLPAVFSPSGTLLYVDHFTLWKPFRKALVHISWPVKCCTCAQALVQGPSEHVINISHVNSLLCVWQVGRDSLRPNLFWN